MTPREYKYHKRRRLERFLHKVSGLVIDYQHASLKGHVDLIKHCEDEISKVCGIPLERMGEFPTKPATNYELMAYKGARIIP